MTLPVRNPAAGDANQTAAAATSSTLASRRGGGGRGHLGTDLVGERGLQAVGLDHTGSDRVDPHPWREIRGQQPGHV